MVKKKKESESKNEGGNYTARQRMAINAQKAEEDKKNGSDNL